MWSQITEWLATYGLLFILQSSHSESFLAVVTYGRKKTPQAKSFNERNDPAIIDD